jgi:hypothetical protein
MGLKPKEIDIYIDEFVIDAAQLADEKQLAVSLERELSAFLSAGARAPRLAERIAGAVSGSLRGGGGPERQAR